MAPTEDGYEHMKEEIVRRSTDPVRLADPVTLFQNLNAVTRNDNLLVLDMLAKQLRALPITSDDTAGFNTLCTAGNIAWVLVSFVREMAELAKLGWLAAGLASWLARNS